MSDDESDVESDVKIEFVKPSETVVGLLLPPGRGKIVSENELKTEEIFHSEIKIENTAIGQIFSSPTPATKTKRSSQPSRQLYPLADISNSPLKKFQCKDCLKRFVNNNKLKRHMLTHSEKRAFHCDLCDYSSNYKNHLSEHLYRHKGEKKVECKECLKKFATNNDLRIHMKIHVPNRIKPFSCDICSASFTERGGIKKHMLTHTNQCAFHCHLCGYSTKYKSHLNSHLRRHRGEKKFKCNECLKKFATNNELTAHVKIHDKNRIKPFSCDICSVSFDARSRLKQHEQIHSEKRAFQCYLCGFSTHHRGSLTGHLNRHIGVKKFECKKCMKKFSCRPNLCRHMKIHENPKVTFSCKICLASFNAPEKLKRHFELHTKRFHCNLCGYSTTHKATLTQHLYRHTGEKKIECNECLKKFITNAELRSHMKIHVTNRIKPFSCDICSASFAERSGIKSHLQFHVATRAFHCELCGDRFKYKTSLRRHLKRHMGGEKKFECKECLKKFRDNWSLKCHIKIHDPNRIKPFSCDICSASFFERKYLKSHAQGHQLDKEHREYECYICGDIKKFQRPCNLKLHMKIHLNKKNMKKHLKISKRTTVSSATQDIHKRKHSAIKTSKLPSKGKPFECGYCTFSTTITNTFIKHKRIHERLFNCSVKLIKLPMNKY